eukprot:CAMPEP_0179122730 /NCGR_PEP_ID=MMETSP0796-20121207/57933_1 /TAXON_ID=73915 /ORGANISM="Pyrodinium bahamense, Strain pbaha01" /LENGTH=134 /DNA_ID=CAMNT_0020821355 /DNA_START=440 /DNA_END=844 /DNA_ORIENTATION=-
MLPLLELAEALYMGAGQIEAQAPCTVYLPALATDTHIIRAAGAEAALRLLCVRAKALAARLLRAHAQEAVEVLLPWAELTCWASAVIGVDALVVRFELCLHALRSMSSAFARPGSCLYCIELTTVNATFQARRV